jgi:two-component system cell cycle sensor histidine kinase/response regulator CckA
VTAPDLHNAQFAGNLRRYKDLFNNSIDGIALHEMIYEDGEAVNYRILDVNRKYEELTGIDKAEAIGSLATEIYTPAAPPFLQEYSQVDRTGRPVTFNSYFAPMGKHFLISAFMTEPNKFAVIFRDITEEKRMKEAILESERRYREIFDASSDAMLIIERDTGQILEANIRASEMFGYSHEELLDKKNWELSAQPEETRRIVQKTRTDLENVRTVPERRLLRKNGEIFPAELTVRSFVSQKRSVLIVAFRDITARKRIEDALRASEQKYRTLIDQAAEGIVLIDSGSLHFTEFNDAACSGLGYSRKEFARLTLFDIQENLTKEELLKKFSGVLRAEGGNFENRQRRKDGTCREVIISNRVVDLHGHQYVLGVWQDITERKKTEQTLRELEERFRLTFYTSPDAVNINRMDGTYLDINDGFTAMTGYTREDAIGRTSSDIMIWDIPEDRERLIKGLREDGYVKNLESRFRMKDGTLKTGLMSASVIQLGGEPHILSISRDISEFKQAEEDKLNLERKLQQAQKMESVGRLAGGVAHDFNNMLGVILGHAELAMDNLSPSHPLFVHLEQIRKAADRSADITRQLLAFARKQIVEPRVIDLNEVVSGIVKMLLRLISEDIELRWIPGRELWQIKIDPSQVDQIVANLCVNARDALKDGGRIKILTGNCILENKYCSVHNGLVSGQYVKIEVGDNGSGIDKAVMPHLFEPFFTTKGVSEGTGLGLATVYGIVRQNNGYINVYSQPGRGTTFTVYLPRYTGPVVKKQPEVTKKPVLKGSETILLVEDEPTILNMTTTMLERLGYTVLPVNSPAEAIRLAEQSSKDIHLVLTDIIMPEMNGRTLVERLKKHRAGMKCLFMSGYTTDLISHHGALDDGVQFIQKPFAKRDLAAKIRLTLGGGSETQQ